MAHRATPVTHRVPPAGAPLLASALIAAIWWMSAPSAGMPLPTLARILADCAAVCALGLAVTPLLDVGAHRADLTARASGPLRIVAVAWFLSELWRMGVMAAQAAGEPVLRLDRATLWLYAIHTDAGRTISLGITVAAMTCSVLLARIPRASRIVIVLVAAGVVSRAFTGHVAATAVGVAAVALHALAAGLWCGVLVGLVMTVRRRSGWARVLPAFSRLASGCVAVLLVSGVLSALLVIESPTELYRTGYGRVLTAKVVLAVVLVAIGWRNRSEWVPAAVSQSISVRSSGRRAMGELAVMVAALASAAILSLAG